MLNSIQENEQVNYITYTKVSGIVFQTEHNERTAIPIKVQNAVFDRLKFRYVSSRMHCLLIQVLNMDKHNECMMTVTRIRNHYQ